MKYALALAASAVLLAGPAWAEGDVEAGEKVFRKCQACHMVGEDAKRKVGPVLNGIFGQQAGTNEDFGNRYSKAMVEMGEEGLVWTPEIMEEYLIKPREYVKGTKMAFAGLPKEEDRVNVVAYLLQFSPDYSPEGDSEAEGDGEAEEATTETN